jgi:hypothetical protein
MRADRAAGVFYMITIVAGVFAEVFARGRVFVRNDAAATAANLLAHESLYRFGLAADVVMLAAYIVVTLLLYVLFKPVDANLSLLAAFFSLIGIAVLASNCLMHVAPLVLSRFPEQALIALKLHSWGYSISGAFFGTYCAMLGVLTYRSRFLPSFLGILLVAGGTAYLIDSFGRFLALGLPDLTIVGGVAEVALALWLIVKGARHAARQES